MQFLPIDVLSSIVIESDNPAAAIITGLTEEFFRHNSETLIDYIMANDLSSEIKRLGLIRWTHIFQAAEMEAYQILEYYQSIGKVPTTITQHLPLTTRKTEDEHLSLIKRLHQAGAQLISRLYDKAAASGYLDIIKFLVSSNVQIKPSTIVAAIDNNQLQVIEYLLENQFPVDENAIAAAVKGRQYNLVHRLIKAKVPISSFTINRIISGGRIRLAMWVIKKHSELIDESVAYTAACTNRQKITRYILHHHPGCITDKVVDLIVLNGQLSIVKLAHRKGIPIHTIDTFDLPTLEYILDNVSDITPPMIYNAIKLAIAYDNVMIVKRLTETKVVIDSKLIESAIEVGNIEIVELLYNLSTSPSDHIIDIAARYGQMSVLKLLLEKGIQATSTTIEEAAAGGHLEVVKFLYENQVIPTYHALYMALSNGQHDVIDYLEQIGTPRPSISGTFYGDVKTLQRLRQYGATINDIVLINAVRCDDVDLVKYILDDNSSLSDSSINEIISHIILTGDVEMMKLFVNKGIYPNDNTIEYAAAFGHCSMIKYLHSIGIQITETTVLNALHNSLWEIVVWIGRIDMNRIPDNALSISVEHGDLKMVELLVELGMKPSNKELELATSLGHVDIVEYINAIIT